jgi:tryptophan-rich sensory protein
MEKPKPIFVILATIAVIVVNYLATEGYIGGITPNYISDKYPTFVTPAGYAFSIWALIYLGLILFSTYQAMPAQADNFKKIRGFYILSCLANCAWIFLWHNQQIVASVGAMLVLWTTLAAINFSLSKEDSAVARVPFGMYFGWVTVASIINIVVCLATLGINISVAVACVLIAVATVFGVLFRLKLPNAAYGLTVTWGIVAIAVKHGGVTAISFVSAIATIILLIVVITPFLRLHEAKR